MTDKKQLFVEEEDVHPIKCDKNDIILFKYVSSEAPGLWIMAPKCDSDISNTHLLWL